MRTQSLMTNNTAMLLFWYRLLVQSEVSLALHDNLLRVEVLISMQAMCSYTLTIDSCCDGV